MNTMALLLEIKKGVLSSEEMCEMKVDACERQGSREVNTLHRFRFTAEPQTFSILDQTAGKSKKSLSLSACVFMLHQLLWIDMQVNRMLL